MILFPAVDFPDVLGPTMDAVRAPTTLTRERTVPLESGRKCRVAPGTSVRSPGSQTFGTFARARWSC